MKIAGLDIGTTGCKLTVFDGSGAYLEHVYQDYPVSRGSSGHEVEAEAIMEGVLSAMKAIGKNHPDIAGIGVTSFGETFVLADDKGRPAASGHALYRSKGSRGMPGVRKKAGWYAYCFDYRITSA